MMMAAARTKLRGKATTRKRKTTTRFQSRRRIQNLSKKCRRVRQAEVSIQTRARRRVVRAERLLQTGDRALIQVEGALELAEVGEEIGEIGDDRERVGVRRPRALLEAAQRAPEETLALRRRKMARHGDGTWKPSFLLRMEVEAAFRGVNCYVR